MREKSGERGESKHMGEREETCLRQWESKRNKEGRVARERERDGKRNRDSKQ